MNAEEFERYAIYAGIHRVRRGWRDAAGRLCEVKPETEILEGRRLTVMAAWQIEDDDNRYPGEWAMTPLLPPRYAEDPGWQEAGLAWVASGDFEELEYVGPYGCAVPAMNMNAEPESATVLYRCPYCGDVWRGPVRPGPTYKHGHDGKPEQYMEPFEDDGRTLDEAHDLRLGVWMA